MNTVETVVIDAENNLQNNLELQVEDHNSNENVNYPLMTQEVEREPLKELPNIVNIDIDYDQQENSWKIPLDIFTSKRIGSKECNKLPKGIRRYYKDQDKLINAFEDMQLNALTSAAELHNIAKISSEADMAEILSKITFLLNIVSTADELLRPMLRSIVFIMTTLSLLLVMKTVAAVMSGSLSVISTVIDSAVDLISGAMIWWSTMAVKKRDVYKYPQGYTRIEPVTIVILAVIMSVASLQMIRESIENIASNLFSDEVLRPIFEISTIVICITTVVIKFFLYISCRRYQSPILQALAQDARNDVLSNTFAVIFGYIGYRYWSYADPIGAIIICLYIIISWFSTGGEQIKMLTGLTAKPELLKKITWAALNHHEKIQLIDTVRAFHFGNNFLVEVDIVLPEEMTVRISHDIAESLQRKIERMPECERCFVHIDFEIEHCPTREHKIV